MQAKIYKHYAVTQDSYVTGYQSDAGIVNDKNAPFIESELPHPYYEVQDENGCYIKMIVDEKIVDTPEEKLNEQLLPQARAKLNSEAEKDIMKGCEYQGKVLPITDAWEAKYLAMEKSYNDGNTESITIDTLDNSDTFTFTPENIEVVTDVLFQYKMSKILICQQMKRDLKNKTYDELLQIIKGQ